MLLVGLSKATKLQVEAAQAVCNTLNYYTYLLSNRVRPKYPWHKALLPCKQHRVGVDARVLVTGLVTLHPAHNVHRNQRFLIM